MRITKCQLRRIIREVAMTNHGSESGRDELATQIRHASKDVYGKKDFYDLEGKSREELEDILYDLDNNPEQRAIDDMHRDEEENKMGRDHDISSAEMAPRRQGFGHRPAGTKSQRRMEGTVKNHQTITKNELRKLIRGLI